MWNTLLLACLALASLLAAAHGQRPRPPERSDWHTRDRLAHPLRADEVALAEPAAERLRAALFGTDDPRKLVEKLHDDPAATRKELQALAAGVKLKARPAAPGVQADGRVALVWWDTKAGKAVRSARPKERAFDPETDRLIAALAVLDNKALRRGKWVEWEDRTSLELPAKWARKVEDGGLGLTRQKGVVRGQAFGPALSLPGPERTGDFTADHRVYVAARASPETETAWWAMRQDGKGRHVNESDRVVALIVYRYAGPADRAPCDHRLSIVSASGKLQVQVRCYDVRKARTAVAELLEYGD